MSRNCCERGRRSIGGTKRSSAGPGAASGRRRRSRDCACLANGADPCRRRARPRHRSGTPWHRRCGCVLEWRADWRGKFWCGCDLLILCLPRSLRRIQVARSGSASPWHWPGPARAATGCIQGIRVTLSGSGLPRRLRSGPAQATARCIRVTGLGGRAQDSVGERRLGAAAGRCAGCTHRNRRDAEAVRPGPARLAGRSITVTEGGWVCAPLKQQRQRAAHEASPVPVQVGPDSALNSATSRA